MSIKFLRGILVGMLFSLALMLITFGVYRLVTRDKSQSSQTSQEVSSDATSQIKGSSGSTSGSSTSKEASFKSFASKAELLEAMLDTYYLNDYDKNEMYNAMLKSMVSSLGDPYSVYYTPEELNKLLETTSGKYCGIGAIVTQDVENKKIEVLSPFENSPAYEAGILPGDEIISIDGVSVVGENIDNVVVRMKGEKGTHVIVGVKRGEEVLEFDIIRDEIEGTYVASKMLDNNVGYIIISQFYELTADQLKKNMENLIEQGAEKFIIDLRGNPGGLYDDVVKCLDYFIEKGQLLIYTETKAGKREEEYSKEGVMFDYPVSILVNGQSASAAEIFSGTMQYYNKAVIVGTQTFGKGIVQAIYPVGKDGSGLKVTISKYYLPSGVCIHGVGVTPNVVVELDEALENTVVTARGYDNQLEAAIKALEGR